LTKYRFALFYRFAVLQILEVVRSSNIPFE